MSGILPFADDYHPIWSPVANEIHAVIWDHVRLEVVQGFVGEWASDWVNDFNTPDPAQQESLARVRQKLHYPDDETLHLLADNLPDDWQLKEALWQPKTPALPLPPSHNSRSLPEKWAGLAAVHDVFDLTGDKVLPWPPPEDDHDIIAFTEWNRGEGGAYQELLRKVSKLPETETYVVPIRRWLGDIKRNYGILAIENEPSQNHTNKLVEQPRSNAAKTTDERIKGIMQRMRIQAGSGTKHDKKLARAYLSKARRNWPAEYAAAEKQFAEATKSASI